MLSVVVASWVVGVGAGPWFNSHVEDADHGLFFELYGGIARPIRDGASTYDPRAVRLVLSGFFGTGSQSKPFPPLETAEYRQWRVGARAEIHALTVVSIGIGVGAFNWFDERTSMRPLAQANLSLRIPTRYVGARISMFADIDNPLGERTNDGFGVLFGLEWYPRGW